MNSFKEVYSNLIQHDQVKVAQVRAERGLPPQVDLGQVDPELLKQAQDYDHIGRVLAHNVFADIVKEAMDEAGVPEEKKDEALEAILAAARGEKPKEEAKEESSEEEKAEEEKKASAKRRILKKMATDPSYVSYLVSKHTR
jgi:FKBP-type peptidyl-prolyl cis-trans isomerase